MSRTTGNELIINGSFHEAFGPVLVIAQCFALLPVVGIKGSSSYGLRFTWKSFRTIYSVAAFCFALSYTIFAACQTLAKEITFKSIGMYLDYSSFMKPLNECFILKNSADNIFHNHRLWSV